MMNSMVSNDGGLMIPDYIADEIMKYKHHKYFDTETGELRTFLIYDTPPEEFDKYPWWKFWNRNKYILIR